MGESPNVLLCVTLVLASLGIGYYAGSHSRTNHTLTSESPTPESDEMSFGQDDCKMVLVVRTDLGMTPGKIAAQCSHATLACYQVLQAEHSGFLRQWENTGQTKVALRCSSEDELLLLHNQAKSLNLCARYIQDAGRTQIAPGSRTVLGIAGPSRVALLDFFKRRARKIYNNGILHL